VLLRKTRSVIFLGLLFFFLVVNIYGDEWAKITKPYKIGPISDIGIGVDTDEDEHIFAAGDSGSNVLWYWNETYERWDESNSIEDYWHKRVVIEGHDPDAGWTLVHGTSTTLAGPYRTTNGLDNWTRRVSGLSNLNNLHALAVNQRSSDLEDAFVGGEGNSGNDYKKLYVWVYVVRTFLTEPVLS